MEEDIRSRRGGAAQARTPGHASARTLRPPRAGIDDRASRRAGGGGRRGAKGPATATADALLSPGVRAPAQARSRDSLERLLAAAARLVNERGLDAVTVGDVVREARSSVGVFYSRFEDKDALLRCLHERFCAAGRTAVEALLAPEAWRGRAAAEIVRALVDLLARADAERAGLVRAFVLASGRDPGYAERVAAIGRLVSERLRALLLERRDQLGAGDPDRAIDFAVWLIFAHHDQRAVFGTVRTSALAWSAAERRDALARAVLAQLGIDERARPARATHAGRPHTDQKGARRWSRR